MSKNEINDVSSPPIENPRKPFVTSELRDTSQELQELREQLAASQLREQQLREVLRSAVHHMLRSKDADLISIKASQILNETTEVTALEALIQKAGEVMRERCLSLRSAHLINSGCVRALPGVTLEDILK